jgi:uncharacterized repeat protein (TIGR04076 family)
MSKENYDVTIKLISNEIKNKVCENGHKVGDEWIARCSGKTPEGLCSQAFAAIYSMVFALQHGARFPWDPTNVIQIRCPDPEVNNVFELRQIPRK